MINLTEKIEFILEDEALHTAVQAAIHQTVKLLEKIEKKECQRPDYQRFGFVRMFNAKNLIIEKKFDKSFLETVFDLCQLPPGTQGSLPSTLATYSREKTPPATGIAALKRGFKLLLVELWLNRALTLPTVFNVGAHFPNEYFDHPLLNWVRTFDAPEKSGSWDARRLYYYGPRLLWATDWKIPSDASLSEIAALSRARVLHQQGKSSAVIAGGNQLPLGLFVKNLLHSFPDEVSFTKDDLARFSQWSLSHSISEVNFVDFEPKQKIKPEKSEKSEKPEKSEDLPKLKNRKEVRLRYENIADQENPHEVLLRNFDATKGASRRAVDWLVNKQISYPGREHIQLDGLMRLWVTCFKAYLQHRKLFKGYRSNTGTVYCLNILSDYLFYYLPWWREIAPTPKVELPLSPRNFSRYAFVARHTEAQWTELPATLLELIRRRRPSNESAKACIHQITLFFSFIETHFADNEEIGGINFKNPINPEFDAPRINTKNKTTKEVIPKNIYGYLLFYCYAIENFGMHLEAKAKLGWKIERNKLRTALCFKASSFDFKPTVTYRGRSHPILNIPNVFTWVERNITINDSSEVRSVYVPHCTVLRLLIAALETGLRAQSVQWLDRYSWRKLGGDTPQDSYTFPLLVNTDKTKTSSWRTYVVHRVKYLLARQEQFQAQFTDADSYGPVEYEGLELSPFDPILPLFRSPGSGYPVNDNIYDKYWKRLMVDFETFYREATGERHVRMFKLSPRVHADGKPIILAVGGAEERPYCPISILAIHTPHACRATFATNRKGVLELSDTAELLGHSNEVVTAHYDKPDEADIRRRLQESDLEIVSDFAQFLANADVHVRADKPDSALVKSFSKDRIATMQVFRFMPPIALWTTEDSNFSLDGLQLLREGPMSKIRFRETHICPVGEECPSDILEQIGEPRRCGSCPLAMKCIDHLPAIAAKRNQLLERIKYQHRRRELLEAAGEPAAVLDELWEALELDVNELLGWKLSEEVLERLRSETTIEGELLLHVEKPEVVKRHLQRVTRSSSIAELVLQRIADSNAYPSMTTPQVQLAASQLKRKLLAGNKVDTLSYEDDGLGDVKDVAAMLALMMKTQGITMKEVAARLSSHSDATAQVLTAGANGGA